MERAVEFYVAVTGLIVGASHVLRARDWCEAFRQMHACGRPGAFLNGALSLVPGAMIVAGHPTWSGPGAVVTGLGWLLVIKGSIGFLVPEAALRSMGRLSSPRGFIIGGLVMIGVAVIAGYCVSRRAVP